MMLYLLTLALPAVGVKLAQEKNQHRIYYQRDTAGFSNVRLQFETMVAIAAAFDRELVIPAPSSIAHISDPFQETLVWSPGEMKNVIHFTVLSDHPDQSHPLCPPGSYVLDKGLEQVRLNELPADVDWCFRLEQSRIRHFECLSMFTPEQQKIATTAVFNGLQFQEHWIETARAALRRLKLRPGAFVAAHIRQGDFQVQSTAWSLSSVYPTLQEHAQGQPLLIATDDEDMKVLEQVRQHVASSSIVATNEVLGPSRFRLEGAITDILICAMAGTFIGTPGSSYSNSIADLRKKMDICKASPLKRAPMALIQTQTLVRATRWFNHDRIDTYTKKQFPAHSYIRHDIGDFDKITDFAAMDHLKPKVCQLWVEVQ